MPSALEVLRSAVDFGDGTNVPYIPYSMADIQILYGLPPYPIHGVGYVWARHNHPQNKLHMCLTGSGIFTQNKNTSGIIEIGILNSSVSTAAISIIGLTGVAAPLSIIDSGTSGTSTVIASAVKRVGTPEWRRELFVGLSIYTFATPRLIMTDGIRDTV